MPRPFTTCRFYARAFHHMSSCCWPCVLGISMSHVTIPAAAQHADCAARHHVSHWLASSFGFLDKHAYCFFACAGVTRQQRITWQCWQRPPQRPLPHGGLSSSAAMLLCEFVSNRQALHIVLQPQQQQQQTLVSRRSSSSSSSGVKVAAAAVGPRQQWVSHGNAGSGHLSSPHRELSCSV
jgi:hypothetical protein